MAVTKRTRFEILRRDNHTCQYCGEKSPNVTLHIDHVMPVALGGDDKPGNLVTACKDCNAGKASIQPDSPLVEALSAQAAAYALGMVDKMTRFRADIESLDDYIEQFLDAWNGWGYGEGEDRKTIPLPPDYEMSLFRWKSLGIPTRLFDLAIPATMTKRHIANDAKFAYLAGIVWNMFNEREIDSTVTTETAAVYTANEGDELRVDGWQAGYESGRATGWQSAMDSVAEVDFLQHHIDQMEPLYEESPFSSDQMFVGLVRRGA